MSIPKVIAWACFNDSSAWWRWQAEGRLYRQLKKLGFSDGYSRLMAKGAP